MWPATYNNRSLFIIFFTSIFSFLILFPYFRNCLCQYSRDLLCLIPFSDTALKYLSFVYLPVVASYLSICIQYITILTGALCIWMTAYACLRTLMRIHSCLPQLAEVSVSLDNYRLCSTPNSNANKLSQNRKNHGMPQPYYSETSSFHALCHFLPDYANMCYHRRRLCSCKT